MQFQVYVTEVKAFAHVERAEVVGSDRFAVKS